MVPKEITEPIAALVRLEMDAALAYDQALAAVPDVAAKDALTQARLHHQRHLLELWQALIERGASPPDVDFRAFANASFAPVPPGADADAALRTLRHNERLLHRAYAEWVDRPLPADVQAIVQRVGDDERRHLGQLESALGR